MVKQKSMAERRNSDVSQLRRRPSQNRRATATTTKVRRLNIHRQLGPSSLNSDNMTSLKILVPIKRVLDYAVYLSPSKRRPPLTRTAQTAHNPSNTLPRGPQTLPQPL